MVIHSINIGIFVLFGIFLEFLNFRDIIRRYLRIEPVVLNVGKIAEPGNCTKLKFRQARVRSKSFYLLTFKVPRDHKLNTKTKPNQNLHFSVSN